MDQVCFVYQAFFFHFDEISKKPYAEDHCYNYNLQMKTVVHMAEN